MFNIKIENLIKDLILIDEKILCQLEEINKKLTPVAVKATIKFGSPTNN